MNCTLITRVWVQDEKKKVNISMGDPLYDMILKSLPVHSPCQLTLYWNLPKVVSYDIFSNKDTLIEILTFF